MSTGTRRQWTMLKEATNTRRLRLPPLRIPPLLHSSNSTWVSFKGLLQQEAGTIWRFLFPRALQQENARSNVY